MFITLHGSVSFRFTNNYFAGMCSGSEEGSYLRRIDFVALNSRLESDKKKKKSPPDPRKSRVSILYCGFWVGFLGIRSCRNLLFMPDAVNRTMETLASPFALPLDEKSDRWQGRAA